jgi:periplasmic divalent cation tolerance protein
MLIIPLNFGALNDLGIQSPEGVEQAVIRFIQISTTVNTKERANKIARTLLDERIASCVQIIGPTYSTYWWSGRVEQAREWICFIKARADDYPKIETMIKKNHPYKVPEILAFQILKGNPDYLNWIMKETTHKPRRAKIRSRSSRYTS